MGLVLCGCSGGTQPKASPVPKPEAKEPPFPIASGAVTVSARDQSGQPAWKIDAQSSEVEIRAKGGNAGQLAGLAGSLYSKGEVASKFSAQLGQADQATKAFSAQGSVRITSVKRGMTLMADRVSWDPTLKIYKASGNVTVQSQDYAMGPFPDLWASADLNKLATPDRFHP